MGLTVTQSGFFCWLATINITGLYCPAHSTSDTTYHYISDCMELHCTALHCTALHCTALHCTALLCTALHCTTLHCTALHCTALHLQYTEDNAIIWARQWPCGLQSTAPGCHHFRASAVCSVQYAVSICSVQCAVCSVKCEVTLCSVKCEVTLCRVQCSGALEI